MHFPMEERVARGGISTQGFESPYLQMHKRRKRRKEKEAGSWSAASVTSQAHFCRPR